jgi:uncharacterized protein DUF11/Calx-beta domain-containing protein/WD40 repeat protein
MMASRNAYLCEPQNAARSLRLAIAGLLLSTSLASAATFSVTNNANTGLGSLRRAINDANANPGRDVITFNLRPNARTILLQTPLARITNAVEIASAQAGVKVVGPGNSIGLEIGANNTTIRGIAIENFEQGIRISSGRNSRIEACSIMGNSSSGVALEAGNNHTIINNVISRNRIGISDGFGSSGTNFIFGNLIGTDASETIVLGNLEYGISGAGYSHLVIGGRASGEGNVISGNGTGISLKLFGKIPSVIQGNFIGTDRTGTLDLGNTWDGVSLFLGSNHVGGVEPGAGNVIAFNGRSGVIADPPTWIQGNRIFANGLLGIEYANANYPLLSHAIISPSATVIGGALTGAPQTSYRIELFASDACDPSGFGEGQRYLGFTTAIPDARGNASFTFDFPEALPLPGVVTATATSLQDGTSRFSPCRPVLSQESAGLSVWQTDYPDPASLRMNIMYTVIISNAGPSRATNVVLQNVFPDLARFSYVQVQPSQGSCSNSFDRTVCSLGDINAGASAIATISFQPYSAGYYTNTATVSSESPDGSMADNFSQEVTVVGVADLGLTLTIGAPPYRAGEPFPVTLHLTNAGPANGGIAEISLFGSYNLSFFPSRVYVTNLQANSSHDIVVSAVPLTNGYFSASAYLYGDYQGDPNFTNNSAYLYGSAEPGPGVLILDREAYAIQEKGQAVLRVLRVGGSDGTLSVAYTTSNGTALATSDYEPTVGQLIFPPGKTEAQIVIPAVADETPECNEFFSVHLFAADDSTFLGLINSALISIAEKPPNLAGYIRPVTVSAKDHRLLVGGSSGPVGLSADGRKLIFTCYAREIVEPPLSFNTHVLIRDLETRTTVQLSPNPTNPSFQFVDYSSPALSGDGRVAAFTSYYWSNGYYSDLIIQDVLSRSNLVVSTRTNSEALRASMISSNGTTVVLVDSSNRLYALNVFTGSNQLVNVAHDGSQPSDYYAYPIKVSDDGRFVLFQSYDRLLTNDLNNTADLYWRDLISGETRLVTVNTNGLAVGSSGGDMSADGRRVVFSAFGGGLSPEVSDWDHRAYVRDMISATTRPVGTNIGSYGPRISADGRFIAYQLSTAGRSDIFLHDTQIGTTTLVTRSCSGKTEAYYPRLSGDGRFIFFDSADIDLTDGEFLPQDYNAFRWDRLTDETTLLSINKGRTGGARGFQSMAAFSHDGNLAAFTSDSSDLVSGDTNGSSDIFVWQAGLLPRLSISHSNQIVKITWPVDSPAAVLEVRTPESAWAPVTGTIQQSDGHYTYEAPTDAPTRFFRLRLL